MAIILPFRLRIPVGQRRFTPAAVRRRRFWQAVTIVSALVVLAGATALQIAQNAARPPADAMQRYYFANCAEARAAHAAPLVAGEPWYRPQLDRDGDGVACEFYLPTAAHDAFTSLVQTVRRWIGQDGAP
jgi:hypothetical protein